MNKRKLIIIIAVAVLIAALAIVLIMKEDKPEEVNPKEIAVESIEVDASTGGISVVSIDSIAGMYVEDGTDEVLSDILAVTFRNDTDVTLQYANLILTVGDEDYTFELTTVPADATVRVMEADRKTLSSTKGDVTLSQENIAWFLEEPTLGENDLKITPTNGAIIVENISGKTIAAPIYVYYKNYVDGVYVGGITYRSGTKEELKPGAEVALSAGHFDTEASQIMFVTYAK